MKPIRLLIGAALIGVIATVAVGWMTLTHRIDASKTSSQSKDDRFEAIQDELGEQQSLIEALRGNLDRLARRVSRLSKGQAGSTATLPTPLAALEPYGNYWGVYWLGEYDDPVHADVGEELRSRGYAPSIGGDLGCDGEARDHLPSDGPAATAVYFYNEQEAQAFAGLIDIEPPPVGVAPMTAYCMD